MSILWACFCAGDILLRREGAEGAFSLPIGEEPPVKLQPWNVVTSVEMKDEHSSLILNVVRLDHPVTGIDALEMMGLRKTHALLSHEEYQLAGKAAELLYWDSNTKYCGVCGAPNRWMTPISKQCTECGKEWWPSVATAIIVRISRIRQFDRSAPCDASRLKNLQLDNCGKEDKERTMQSSNCKSSNCQIPELLLVRARNFRTNHYGLVAGFLETGESLEQCVAREVREEVGIRIKNLRYFASQPWPYPFGLMVGFTAEYDGGDIHLQKEELTQGGWFTRDNLPPIPDKASIARQLIDDWLQQS